MADPEGDQERTEARLRDLLQRVRARDPWNTFGVHGIGIGHKLVDGRDTGELALRFHVAQKRPDDELDPSRRVPEAFDDELSDGTSARDLPTDVVESPPPELHAPDLASELRPVPGGASISAPSNVGTGTAGGWVFDHTDQTIVLLSNFHVLGTVVGGEVIQPGTTDGGQPGVHRIGAVKRFVPISAAPERPTPADCNLVDAAIAEADDTDLFDLTVVDIGPAVYTTTAAAVGMAVHKTGQTTGHTTGVVTDIGYDVLIQGFPGIGAAAMCDTIRVVPSDPADQWGSNGDSGSIVFAQVDEGLPPAVGLHFGGGGVPPSNWGVACRIDHVFAALDLGPLCDGGFAAFIEAAGIGTGARDAPAGTIHAPGAVFTRRERRRVRTARHGLARDVQRRLSTSPAGRHLVEAVADHRAELLSLLVRDGDVRRSMNALLGPALRDAVTTTDVLSHRVTGDDLRRLRAVLASLDDRASRPLRHTVTRLREAIGPRTGVTVAALLDVEP